ncbi:putative multidrug resistance ABC transporter ATP-binding/permease protein YheI [Geobacter sp. OR-1]|nr:putative multidrug resistance ABC transporter ATP-binding/permease protein YheI [Geobacter sp. OR-1]
MFSRTTLLHAARRIEYRIRDDLYAKLLTLDQSFFAGERTGDLISRFSNDLTNVRMLVGFGVLNIINSLVLYIAALALMIRLSPTLTLYAVLPFPAMIFVVKRMSASMFRRSKRSQEELARLTSAVEENVSAAPLIKAYCREAAAIGSFREASERYMASNMRVAQLRGFMIPVMAATGALGTLIVLLVGGGKVVSGVLTLGDFVAFNGYLAMLIWPTIMLGWILNLSQRGAASMERLNWILAAVPRVSEPAEPAAVAKLQGEIELCNLVFAYGAETVLRGISLKIARGSRLGIVGPIGAGKSTLVRMLARLHPVEDGMIRIDGIDINRIPITTLRNSIGFVPQEGFLFSRTIAENVTYGREGANNEKMTAAARMAGLHDEVSRFPDGYETLVGERGITLSGGQKQRTSIARALIKDPAILILDDPLSAVDAHTEEEILTNLAGYYGSRTVIIVSHRISALRDCDLIVAIEDGRIVEQGSHVRLLEIDGRYAQLYREQQLLREIESY